MTTLFTKYVPATRATTNSTGHTRVADVARLAVAREVSLLSSIDINKDLDKKPRGGSSSGQTDGRAATAKRATTATAAPTNVATVASVASVASVAAKSDRPMLTTSQLLALPLRVWQRAHD